MVIDEGGHLCQAWGSVGGGGTIEPIPRRPLTDVLSRGDPLKGLRYRVELNLLASRACKMHLLGLSRQWNAGGFEQQNVNR